MSGLPKGWVEATLGDLFEITSSKRVHQHEWTETGVPFYRAREVKKLARDGYVENELFISEELFRRYAANFGAPVAGDLMVTAVGTLGECYRVRQADRFYFKDASVLWFRAEGKADSEFIARIFATEEVREQVHKGGGTTVGTYTVGSAKETVVRLPPLAEQKRIVAKLVALNAKSARARTELARIETLVSRYKQAVLSKAFSGELVGLVPAATEKPHALCWDLPLGWRWVVFEEAVEIASNLVDPNTVPDLPHIAPDNIESGTARLLPFRTIREDGVISAKHRFYSGQILYSKIRPYLRKAVVVDFDGACSADMYPLSPRDVLSARYLLQWLVGEQFTHFAVEHQGRTVLPKINQSALNRTPLPLPPLATQQEIVRRVETAFAKIDRLAKEAKRALELVGRLDEAILAKAFRGELVPQDESDEPAEHLLARIRAERQAALKDMPRGKLRG